MTTKQLLAELRIRYASIPGASRHITALEKLAPADTTADPPPPPDTGGDE